MSRRWMAVDEIDSGGRERLTCAEKAELVEMGRTNRVLETEIEILKRASCLLRGGEHPPEMSFRLGDRR